jgi:hypothetical protein
MIDAASTPLSIEGAIAQARAMLEKPLVKPVSAWRGLGAAAAMAFAALTLAAAVILGPGGGGPTSEYETLSHWQP